MPSAIPCSLSPLISRIHSCLFSDWRRTVSSKFFDTQVPSISTKELVLPHHAHCVLSCLRCNGHSLLLGSYLSRIGRIENPSCSACGHLSQDTSHLVLHCPAMDSAPLTLWRLSVSLQPLVQTLGSYPDSGALWSPAMPPSLGRGRVTNNNNNKTREVLQHQVGNSVWPYDGGREELGRGHKKFIEKRKAERGMRLLGAESLAELTKVTSGFAMQSLRLGHSKVRPQVVCVKRCQLLGRRAVGKARRGGRRNKTIKRPK